VTQAKQSKARDVRWQLRVQQLAGTIHAAEQHRESVTDIANTYGVDERQPIGVGR
jgi:hypothetical protein